MKKLILLGASGSVGSQSLEVIANYPNLFSLEALSVGHRDQNLESIIEKFNVKAVCLFKDERRIFLSSKYPKVKFYAKAEILDLINDTEADLLINAIVGIAGLKPTICAIENKMNIALANKETLVTGGELIMDLAKANDVEFYPVDSEHSAIWQALVGNEFKDVESITLTASGGSFRHLDRTQLEHVTKAEALAHPNWSMGAKITIDSATMMNKGLEVIEAHYLFNIDYAKINVLINHQSAIHSFVQFNDYSILAQLGSPSMKVPIQFALTYPNHLAIKDNAQLDLAKLGELTFQNVDFKRFPLVKLAYEVGEKKGNLPIVMNAANEIAVGLFLEDKIKFIEIEKLVINTVKSYPYETINSFEEIFIVNSKVRTEVIENYKEIISR